MAAASEDVQFFKPAEDASQRGIPEAIFLDNVESACKNREPAELVGKLQDLYSKYQYMSSSLVAQRASLKQKLPDISSALDTVNHLHDRKAKAQEGDTQEYTYQLSENIWSKASAPPANCVCLWLGANCMLEYTLDEARDLLQTNEKNANETLKTLETDLGYLRDQITTTEVNIARCHNYGVKLRQKAKAEGGEDDKALPSSGAAESSQAAKGNGAYTFKQEKQEVEVSVRMPKDAQKSDVKVTILMDSLKVEHAGKVLLEGSLAGKCSPNGSTWTMTGSRVEISLEKADETHWPSLFE